MQYEIERLQALRNIWDASCADRVADENQSVAA